MTTRTVGSEQIKATKWEKHGKSRIYFQRVGIGQKGQACWDLNKGEWVNVHCEFGWKFKSQIAQIFADMIG